MRHKLDVDDRRTTAYSVVHKRLHPRSKDLTGQTFGRWTVLKRAYTYGCVSWLCRCECGSEKVVAAGNLLSGGSKSCGTGHGLKRDSEAEYHAYQGMKQRCLNPRNAEYVNYGGRSITICDRWLRGGYDAFIADVGRKPTPGHTLDRIDNSGNYEPRNVRWASKSEQQLNRRVSLRLLRVSEDGSEEPISIQTAASYLALSYSAFRTSLIRVGVMPIPARRPIGPRSASYRG